MKRLALVGLLGLLASCGTPQEQCINGATRDLRVVDDLIAETEANLARGYAYEYVTIYRTRFVDCTPIATPTNPSPRPRDCVESEPETARRAVAIDLNVEAAKLASLRAKRSEQSRQALPVIDECKRVHPE